MNAPQREFDTFPWLRSSAVRRGIFVAPAIARQPSSVGAAYSAPDGAPPPPLNAGYNDAAPDGANHLGPVNALREEYTRTIEPARTLAAETLKLECALNDLVNQAYGLTPAEIALMWQTAPPRMPIPPPTL